MRPLHYLSVLGILLTVPAVSAAETSSFSDVSPQSPFFNAVEYLKERGAMSGYADGTFRPDAKVNRAEAVKVIVSTLSGAPSLDQYSSTEFTDVPADAWFLPYVEYARQKLKIIDGPPAASAFKPSQPVLKAQFLKMFFLANGVDSKGMYSELKQPLSNDVSNPDEWFFPHMRYAIASSMTMVTSDGAFNPGKELTRGEISLLLYRYYMYKDGRRTQALLSETESEIVNVLQLLDKGALTDAEFASSRSMLAARGALTSKPGEAIVKGAVKISEGFQLLVRAYKAGAEKRYDDVIDLSGQAWHLAEKAMQFDSSLTTVGTQMQTISKGMADEARKLK